MCWNREEVKKKMEELFPDFTFDENTSTLTANIKIVEDKTDIKVNSQPLFTLTAEEVEIVRLAIIGHCSDIDNIITLHSLTGEEPKNKEEIKRLYNVGHNLLTRIKQWQDEK